MFLISGQSSVWLVRGPRLPRALQSPMKSIEERGVRGVHVSKSGSGRQHFHHSLGVRTLSYGCMPLTARSSGDHSRATELGGRKNRFGQDKGSMEVSLWPPPPTYFLSSFPSSGVLQPFWPSCLCLNVPSQGPASEPFCLKRCLAIPQICTQLAP